MHDLAPTPFIGRTREIDEISALLEDSSCRLLSLVGPGGMGKTRLALEIAARKQDSFPDGIFFVPLAPLSRPDDILAAIAEATPFRFQQDSRDSREQFFDYLREKQAKRMLLVLDNFEHLLDGVDIISEILEATSDLKILTTSREALNLQEEWVRQIAGMAYPDQTDGQPLEAYSAVQLFVDRARRIRGDFDLSEDSGSVVEICRLVDGMPLAIELAAGWLTTLRPADIVQEIRRNMDILATRSRNLPERHRSIRSVFSHSWRLMSPEERDVFAKLSVFRGGFTREAAEVVAGASLRTLAGLVDKSLMRLSATGRYDIHEVLRQYGAEQLEAAGQTEAIQRAYLGYYLGMLRRLENDIKGERQIAALDLIAADFENVRDGWQLAVQLSDTTALDQAVESLHFFGDMRGRYHDVVPLLRAAVEQLAPTPSAVLYRIQARLIRNVLLGNMRIDFDVRGQIDACLEAARVRGDQAEVGFCLMVLGIVAVWESESNHGDPSRSALIFRESCAVYAALGDRFYEADVLAWAASKPAVEDDLKLGGALLQQSLDLRREIGDPNGIAWITLNLTYFMLDQLDYAGCERFAREALALMREIGSLKGVLQAMDKLGWSTFLRGDLEESRALAEQMRDLADGANNLDGKMQAAALLALLVGVMDEDYAQSAALARQSHAISLEPFFGGHYDAGSHWGQAVTDCGQGHFAAYRQNYASLLWRRDDPAPATICLALEAAACAHDGALEHAAELLSLAFHQPVWASGWLDRWGLLARLRDDLIRQLGEDAFEAAWERGCQSDLEATIGAILDEPEGAPPALSQQPLLEPLSERELEILHAVAAGRSNRQIAAELFLALGTVKWYLNAINGKLGVSTRTQAVARARDLGLLS